MDRLSCVLSMALPSFILNFKLFYLNLIEILNPQMENLLQFDTFGFMKVKVPKYSDRGFPQLSMSHFQKVCLSCYNVVLCVFMNMIMIFVLPRTMSIDVSIHLLICFA